VRLLTSRLELRDFCDDDLAEVHAYASDHEVVRYLWWGPFDRAAARSFLGRTAREAQAVPRLNYELAVVDRERNAVIGGCELLARRSTYREYEIGYCLGRAHWGVGLGDEVVRGLLSLAFGAVNAHRVYGLVDPENDASRRLLERIGFRLEGRLVRDSLIRGEWRDSLIYALLAEEWTGRSSNSDFNATPR
jgi:RimJ/RimL family protein N-acetyltransferase